MCANDFKCHFDMHFAIITDDSNPKNDTFKSNCQTDLSCRIRTKIASVIAKNGKKQRNIVGETSSDRNFKKNR